MAYSSDVNAPLDPIHLILYDGVCGLCNGFVQFVLPRDTMKRFRFIALQDSLARRILADYGRNPDALDTIGVLTRWKTSEESLLVKSDAALFVLRELGGIWSLAIFGRVLPRGFRDWCYDRVANVRYLVFGRLDVCPVPTKEQRARFIVSDANP